MKKARRRKREGLRQFYIEAVFGRERWNGGPEDHRPFLGDHECLECGHGPLEHLGLHAINLSRKRWGGGLWAYRWGVRFPRRLTIRRGCTHDRLLYDDLAQKYLHCGKCRCRDYKRALCSTCWTPIPDERSWRVIDEWSFVNYYPASNSDSFRVLTGTCDPCRKANAEYERNLECLRITKTALNKFQRAVRQRNLEALPSLLSEYRQRINLRD